MGRKTAKNYRVKKKKKHVLKDAVSIKLQGEEFGVI